MVSAPVAVLDVFGVEPDALLGYGGEARVYALGRERILRVHHEGTPAETVGARTRLLEELAEHADRVPFAIPTVLETRLVAGHVVTLEERLPGRPLTQVLDEASGERRASLVRTYLDTAQELGELPGTVLHEPKRSVKGVDEWCGHTVLGQTKLLVVSPILEVAQAVFALLLLDQRLGSRG